MRILRALAALAGLALAIPAAAQNPAEETLALEAAVTALNAACAPGREADTACAVAIGNATPLVTTALATIGETRDRAAYAAGVRLYLESPVPEIRAAAAFALARLFPDATDTPLLLALLQEPVGGVRIGALAALRESSDPIARILAERTTSVENIAFFPEEPPYDPARLGVTLPADAVYVPFERDEIERGTLVFTTTASPAEAIAAIEAAGAGERFDLRAVPQWLRNSGIPMFAIGQGFADATGIVLAGRLNGGAGQPIRIALVYRDTIVERTGIALTWSPAAEVPFVEAPPLLPLAELPPLEPPAEIIVKPDAAAADTAMYLDVMLAEGIGAAAYLEMFPEGAYRAEIEALLETALIVELADYRVRPGAPVTISFRNLPGNPKDWFTIMAPATPIRDYDDFVFTAGATTGAVTLTAPTTPGEYELRVLFDNTYVVERRIPLIVDAAAPIPGIAGPAGPAATTAGAETGPVGGATAGALALAAEPTAGAPIVVRYTGLPGSAGAWMTIVPIGTPDTQWEDWEYTTGTTGEVTLPGQPAGAYELRAVVETPRRSVVARLPITIVAGAPVAAAEPVALAIVGTAAAGQPLVIRYANVPDRPSNWVTIVPAGTPDAIWGNYVYAPAGTAGEVTLPGQPAGRYEIRFLVETPRREIVARLGVAIE